MKTDPTQEHYEEEDPVCYYVDIPHMYRKDEFYNMGTFDTWPEAIEFAHTNFGADKLGRISLVSGGKGPPPETVSVIIVIKAGVMEVCKVFEDDAVGDVFYEAMKEEYEIDPISPNSCAEDVLNLREEIK